MTDFKMVQIKLARVLMLTGCVVFSLLIFLLIGLQAVPLAAEKDVPYIAIASLQIARCSIFQTDTYILKYTSVAKRVQGISAVEIAFTNFERDQEFLTTYNASDIQGLLQQMNGDYLAIVTEVKTIKAHPADPIDEITTTLFLAHTRNYGVIMYNLEETLRRHNEARNVPLIFILEVIIEVLLVIVVITLTWIVSVRGELKQERHGITIEHADTSLRPQI